MKVISRVARLAWFHQPVVLISHAFTNWRLGEKSHAWRWALLPELYAQARKLDGRFPRDYVGNTSLSDPWVRSAASSICAATMRDLDRRASSILADIKEKVPWPSALDAAEYRKNGTLRAWLEKAVGLGLGTFDLVVIDEAHKSRGVETRLSALLANVIHERNDARRLGLTATTIELGEHEWIESLNRVGISGPECAALSPIIERYARAARRLRIAWRTSEDARSEYCVAADAFQRGLEPYVLRRDKREEPMIRAFARASGEQRAAYREEEVVPVQTTALDLRWKRIVCAAEALSVTTRLTEDSTLKRLRLTLGNGHGIAALADQAQRDESEDRKQEEYDAAQQANLTGPGVVLSSNRERRTRWWRGLLESTLASQEALLFEHPAILSAVQAIEQETQQGEKVLVFGRFTRPMRALVDLLNARELIRRLEAQKPWPGSKVHETDQPAVRVALKQLGSPLAFDDLDAKLEKQYAEQQRIRTSDRDQLFTRLSEGLREGEPKARALLRAVHERLATGETEKFDERNPLTLLTKALRELTSGLESNADWAAAFTDLIDGVTDRDEGDDDGDGGLDPTEASQLWAAIEQRLREEYNRPQGGFARLMNGETSQASRRMLQLAFNRAQSFPRVLVAQSLVGREGLNLHRASRSLVLLHPEWNPGVVEQQIGRVDRVGSRWETLMKQHRDGEPLPRIKVRPIVFLGTYDEHHLQVLRERMDDHRAQLHGEPIPPRLAENDPEGRALIEQLSAAAPNFSPEVARR